MLNNTTLEYLDDTYAFKGMSKLLSEGRDEKGRYIVLDRTIFYPQGGGQPSDTGTIETKTTKIQVWFVGYSDGIVRHYTNDDAPLDLAENEEVQTSIDIRRRLDNARTHTAGHLISHVVESMYPGVLAVKGYHFPDGAHVEFMNPQRISIAEKLEEIEALVRNEINSGGSIEAQFASYDDAISLTPHLAAYIPTNKPSRIVTISSFSAQPCGGTHVANLSQLGNVSITRIKNKKDRTKISYEMGPPTFAA